MLNQKRHHSYYYHRNHHKVKATLSNASTQLPGASPGLHGTTLNYRENAQPSENLLPYRVHVLLQLLQLLLVNHLQLLLLAVLDHLRDLPLLHKLLCVILLFLPQPALLDAARLQGLVAHYLPCALHRQPRLPRSHVLHLAVVSRGQLLLLRQLRGHAQFAQLRPPFFQVTPNQVALLPTLPIGETRPLGRLLGNGSANDGIPGQFRFAATGIAVFNPIVLSRWQTDDFGQTKIWVLTIAILRRLSQV